MTAPPDQALVAELASALAAVRARIAAACASCGRDPASVELVAVGKTQPVEAVRAAYAAGQRVFGENYVQELVAKAAACADLEGLRWHFIGHLQRNKVREVVPRIHALHSLDSVRLVEAVSVARAASDAVGALPCYLEVNVAGEAQKEGVPPSGVGALLAAAAVAPGVEVVGLMTVAPLVDDPEDARPVFRALRELASAHGLRELSMGMTNDFEVAIEEGATLVRVGRAIFGERPSA